MQGLESRLSLDFLKGAIIDYKELFLAPLKTVTPASERRSSAMIQASTAAAAASEALSSRVYSRHSNLKAKEVIVLKTENEEKTEVRDLAKFVSQLTQGFFREAESILLEMEVNTELREALSMLDQSACALQALCHFEYRIERQGEHSGRLLLNKQ